MKPVIFIVGVGRSGTSLAQSMLATNPKISYLPETAFIRRYVFREKLQKISVKAGFAGVKEHLENDKTLSRLNIPVHELLYRSSEKRILLDVTLYRSILDVYSYENAQYVGDKDPRLIEFFPLVRAVTFNSYMLHVIRDPRDVLASKKKAAWSKQSHVFKHVFAGRVQIKIGCRQGPKVYGARYYELLYEDLITQPETSLKDICESIGIPFYSDMLSFGKAAEALVSDEEMGWKKETLGPLLVDNHQKWKEELTNREIKLTELCSAEAMNKGGYEYASDAASLSILDSLWVWIGMFIIKAATYPYIWYRSFKVRQACRRLK
jgi:hypothetical protein